MTKLHERKLPDMRIEPETVPGSDRATAWGCLEESSGADHRASLNRKVFFYISVLVIKNGFRQQVYVSEFG